jgi:hypothetical protein
MRKFLVRILIFTLSAATTIFYRLVRCFKWPVFLKGEAGPSVEPSTRRKTDVLDCRVKLTKEQNGKSIVPAFSVEIYGSIHAPSKDHDVTVKIFVVDITDGIHKAKPAHTHVEEWQIRGSRVFCYTAELGRLPRSFTILSDWVVIGQIPVGWLELPRKGKRKLYFGTSILSHQSSEELARAVCIFTYQNDSQGYIDLEENIRRAKTLAVPLAFAVAGADKRISDGEVRVIKGWVMNNIAVSKVFDEVRCKLSKLFSRIISLFPNCNRARSHRICEKITGIAPLAVRCDILNLCLRVVRGNSLASIYQLVLLKNVAGWFEISVERFRSMIEKIVPVAMHEGEDIEIKFGITPEMDKEDTCRQLSQEYRKWNARVTNYDPEIQAQAEYMLKLIAQARDQYVK